MKIVKCTLLFLSLLMLFSCVKEEEIYTIPYASVYFKVDINGLDSDLTHFSYKTFTEGRTIGESTGFGGLLVFRNSEGNIFAFDLCCPHERAKDIRVVPSDVGEAICPTCHRKYVFWTGTGHCEQGGASLQKYAVYGSTYPGVFHIRNR